MDPDPDREEMEDDDGLAHQLVANDLWTCCLLNALKLKQIQKKISLVDHECNVLLRTAAKLQQRGANSSFQCPDNEIDNQKRPLNLQKGTDIDQDSKKSFVGKKREASGLVKEH
ncbi:hypothetical protein O6H91_Y156000 [Diphasiastrum complanatum]|nr:hypothetical protein O6H91_Y156000 [Diphasiastrum complanatum]